MASNTIVIFSIFIFLTLSSTINARESQFFAKFSNNNPSETKPLNTNQQNPNFTPQSQEQEDGFSGHESGQLPPSTTTTAVNNYKNDNLPVNLPENYNPVAYTTPIHSSTQDIPEEYRDPPEYKYNGGSEMYKSEKQGMSDTRFLENGKYYYGGGNGYNSEKQGFDDARFMENEDGGGVYNEKKQGESGRFDDARFTETEDGGAMYNSQKRGESGRYNSQKQRYSTTNNGNMYNTGKQGMSDTRFLENGKYFYDLNMENENLNRNTNTRGYNSRNEYNTQGYYGNNENSYDRYNSNGNNDNSYDRYNSNGGYQNQEEFQEDQYNP